MAPAVLATICLAIALVITFGLAMATSFFTAPPLKGPDTMGYFMVFLALGFRWLLTLVAIILCVTAGKFAWLSPRAGIAGASVIAAHAGLGVIASLAWMAWAGQARWFTLPAANLGAIALPVLVQLLLAALAWSTPEHAGAPRWPRFFAWPLGALGAVGLLAGAVLLVQWQIGSLKADAARLKERDDAIEQNRLDTLEREKRQAEELAAIPDDAPLQDFLAHLFIDKSEAHHAAALARIAALPDLTGRLAERLADPDPRQREYAANFIRMNPAAPDPAWLPAVRGHLALLASDIKSAPALLGQPSPPPYRGLTQGALMTARRFQASSPPPDFTQEIIALREAFTSHEESQVRTDALDLLDRFESGRPLQDE